VLERRVTKYALPTFAFVLLYSKLPHKVRKDAQAFKSIFDVTSELSILNCIKNVTSIGAQVYTFCSANPEFVSSSCSIKNVRCTKAFNKSSCFVYKKIKRPEIWFTNSYMAPLTQSHQIFSLCVTYWPPVITIGGRNYGDSC
jgi:hypothetical protein